MTFLITSKHNRDEVEIVLSAQREESASERTITFYDPAQHRPDYDIDIQEKSILPDIPDDLEETPVLFHIKEVDKTIKATVKLAKSVRNIKESLIEESFGEEMDEDKFLLRAGLEDYIIVEQESFGKLAYIIYCVRFGIQPELFLVRKTEYVKKGVLIGNIIGFPLEDNAEMSNFRDCMSLTMNQVRKYQYHDTFIQNNGVNTSVVKSLPQKFTVLFLTNV